MIDSFATPEIMEERTRGLITATSYPGLARELKAATRTIRNACHWHIATQEQLTYQRRRPHAETVWLPAMEIASIDNVILDGMLLSVGDIDFDPDTGWTPLFGRSVRIAYTAGFTPIPEDLVTLTLELAAGGLVSPVGISKEQAGGVSVTLDRVSSSLTPADIDRLAAYTIGVVP